MLSDRFDMEPPHDAALMFDDAPLEAILYGGPGGPTPTDLFSAARPILVAIDAAVADNLAEDALRHMRTLYDEGIEVPEHSAAEFVTFVGQFVPVCAWPMIPENAFPYETILQPIFDQAMGRQQSALADSAGLILSRCYEAGGRFAESRTVLSALLASAQTKGERLLEAQHSNNLGYEFLLEGDWSQAEGHCQHAAALFAKAGATSRANNARANGLIARFDRLGLPKARVLEPEIAEVQRFFEMENDSRRRKTLVLLARLREYAGHLDEAVELMKAAVLASQDVPTQHRLADQAYLRRIQDRVANR